MIVARNTFNLLFFFAFLLAASVSVWLLIIAPLNAWKAKGVDTRNQVFLDIQRTKSTLDRLKHQSAIISQSEDGEFLWRAEQIGAVTAQIQTSLSASATESGLAIRSITPLKTKQLASVDAAGFRLEFEATLNQIVSFLQSVEYSSPALLIEKASLRQISRIGNSQQQPILNVQLELIAPFQLSEGFTE